MAIPVTVDNFARAETHRMFAAFQADAGGVNRFEHNREPTPIDHQTVIRMNRDTLYSIAVVDAAERATVTIPDAGSRYVSLMVVDQDHYVLDVLHEPGEHPLKAEKGWIGVAARVLVDPSDDADIAAVHALQDGIRIAAGSSRPFEPGDYDTATLDGTRQALLALARHTGSFDRSFGGREEVDPVRHLIGAAAGWGGLPDREARYVAAEPGLPAAGAYRVTVRDVPVDGFWSISVYNADGFFEPNDLGAYSVNNLTATPNDDGSVTVHFGGCDDGRPNCLPITDGWNYTVRLYRPRPEVLDGSWTFPAVEPV
jgi:hypothetical protein